MPSPKRKPADSPADAIAPKAGKISEPTLARVPVSKLLAAPYNPRMMSAAADRKLRHGLERFGMAEVVIWNKRTGHVVGGHQRLRMIKEDRGWTPGDPDFLVQVSVVDLDDTREKELNLLLNSPGAQGEWDLQKVGELLQGDKDLKLENFGWEAIELLETPELDTFDLTHLTGVKKGEAADAEEIRKIKESRGKYKDEAREAENELTTVRVVFQTVDQVNRFLAWLKLPPGQEFVDGVGLCADLGISLGEASEPEPEPAPQPIRGRKKGEPSCPKK